MINKAIHVYRGAYIESTHEVHIAVVNAQGELIAYYGDPNRRTFARSSMKPFQATPVVESGAMEDYHLTDRELSLFCASHIGEPYHREAVANVLQKINLDEKHLQCGTHIPRHKESYEQLIKQGRELTPFYSNCSGKHAGMLTGVVKQHMDIETYREANHPYQQQIIDVIEDVSGYDKEKLGISVDGCGVPVHRIPLKNIALLFARLATPDQWTDGDKIRKQSLQQIKEAMVTYPEMVAGTHQYDTDLMRAYENRIVAKGGAEAVHCFGDQKTGMGVAIKVADGNARGASVASTEVQRQLNIGDQSILNQLSSYHHAPVLNARDEKIGLIKPAFQLKFL